MDEWMDKTLILGFGFLLIVRDTRGYESVAVFLAAVIAAELGIYMGEGKWKPVLFAVILSAAYAFPALLFFCPVFLYDMAGVILRPAGALGEERRTDAEQHAVWTAVAIEAALLFGMAVWRKPKDPVTCGFLGITAALAVVLAYRTKQKRLLAERLICTRDSGVELNRMLEEKNRRLLEKQDYEIHLATLRERNRIAREIHDNVGHMLSRTLLLTGALLTTEKEGAVHGQLLLIRKTLDAAMDSIRQSVHDLHEESIDLKHSLEEILEPVKGDFTAELDYDMSKNVPRKVKYALIAIAKEAVSNTIRHSGASAVRLRCREHPGFYQFSAEDDGRGTAAVPGGGLGLRNMKERVDALGGTFHVHTRGGFCVFVTIPKTEEMICGQ